MRGLMWFREDLRLNDNLALNNAAKCKDGMVAIYLIDIPAWKKHDIAACRVEFILQGLFDLKNNLDVLNIPLLLYMVSNVEDIKKALSETLSTYQITNLFFNKQYEIDEQRRDESVTAFLMQKGISCLSYDDQTILSPGTVKNLQGNFYKVFTAFKNAWVENFINNTVTLSPKPKKQKSLAIQSSDIPLQLSEFSNTISLKLWPASEKYAMIRLKKFINSELFSYDKKRDVPIIDATSRLSPYLAAGMISSRTCFLAALAANSNKLKSGNNGALTWMNELIWRDFYKHLLAAYPKLSMHQPFQEKTNQLKWNYNEKHFKAWCEGKTGFPIIDAAMRQLNQTGWMHNRLRMIVAMFFSKNLLLDWRLGEKYFMQHLIDGDLAANNGGWQWCASTGTDAAPYFRIFNPISQSLKFDKDGEFIRTYCPELEKLDKKSIHMPSALQAHELNYPPPIVDLKKTRLNAITAFKNL